MSYSFYLAVVKASLVFISLFFYGVSQSASNIVMLEYSGGNGGRQFMDLPFQNARIQAISVRTKTLPGNIKVIAGIRLTYKQGNQTFNGRWLGGQGDNQSTFTLRNGEYITQIYGRSGAYVDSLKLTTNQNRRRHWGGNGGSRTYGFKSTPHEPIIGIWGREGALIDAIGVVRLTNQQVNTGKAANEPPSKRASLRDFRPREGGGGDKADTAGLLDFPKPHAGNPTIDYWVNGYNRRLREIIVELSGPDPGLNKFWQDEKTRCGDNRYCAMSYRREAIAFISGVN